MSDTKHTPGPWEVWKGHLTVVAGPTNRNTSAVVSGARRTVAEADCDDFDPTGEEIANARLIAAAPDLLEAARALDALYGWAWDTTDGGIVFSPEGVARFEAAHSAVSAAIDKAEGR